MFKKFGIGMLAVVLAVAFSAFTAPKQQPAPAFDPPVYYWYEVNLSTNQIDQGQQPFAIAPASEVEACDPAGNDADCARGFLVNPDTSDGPVSAQGDDQKKIDL